MTTKNELRKMIREKRDAIPAEERAALSAAIAEKLFTSEFWLSAAVINCFVSFASEVDTMPIISRGIAEGKTICVPRVNPETDAIELRQITDIEKDLEPGKYGILEPNPKTTPLIEAHVPMLHIIPGLVFDRRGNRIGFGKGYYDKFLKDTGPYSTKLSPAFSMQIVQRIPADARDIPVDIIITEKEIIMAEGYDSFEDGAGFTG